MRPLRLQIAGLNSFKEAQEIDFRRLCTGNVFGIFGPTGSGKSTVVDAITLALYGTVKRASRKTQGIINKALTEASVLFEWQLGSGDGQRTYRVERKYVAKDESVVCRLARLCELRGEETIVLADKTSLVDQTVLQILGLTEDDFTRAVVLPQGRFAEFLNLQGSERRRMLERIFGLEEYGEQLNRLVNDRYKAAETKLQAVLRAEEVLGPATEPDVAAAREQVLLGYSQLAASRETCRQTLSERDRLRQVRERQQELAAVQADLREWERQALEIDRLQARIERQAAAARIADIMGQADKAAKRSQEAAAALALQSTVLADCREQAEAASLTAQMAAADWQAQQGPLRERQQQLERAVVLEQKLRTMEEQVAAKLRLGQAITRQVELGGSALAEARRSQAAVLEELTGLELELAGSRIEPERRERLAAAVVLAGKAQQVKSQLQDVLSELSGRQQQLLLREAELVASQQQLQEQQALLAKQQAALGELALAMPNPVSGADLEQASVYQSLAQQATAARETCVRLAQTEGQQLSRQAELQQELETLGERFSEAERMLSDSSRQVIELTQELARAREQNLAAILASNLQAGQPCPVCGASAHPQLAMAEHGQKLEQLEQTLQKAQAAAESWQATKLTAQADIAQRQQDLARQQAARELVLAEQRTASERLRHLLLKLPAAWAERAESEDLSLLARAHFEQLAESLKQRGDWQAELDRTKALARAGENQVAAVSSQIDWLQQTMIGQQAEISRLLKRQTTLEEQQAGWQAELRQLLLALEETDVDQAVLRQQQLDQRFAELLSLIREARQQREQLASAVSEREQSQSKLLEEQAQARTEYRLQTAALAELTAEWTALTGGQAAAALLAATKARLDELSQAAMMSDRLFGELKQLLAAKEQEQGVRQEAYRLAELAFGEASAGLALALARERFATRGEAEEALASLDLVPAWQQRIAEYQSRLQSLGHRAEQLTIELNGQSLAEATWRELVEQAEAALLAQEQAIAALAQAEEWLKQLQERHQRWLQLEGERLQLVEEKALLGELVSLLRGNALVEFMAAEHLDAIARAASDWLGLLSGRRYALLVAPDGGFLVRDDQNGAERRPVYTLSGGETFITSLALALALSAQIQLRGQHRLEFFFLDEGFGSLDPQLLEVVMGCLERMRGQQLSIGLISHVPELRERILCQVQVQPAEAGGRGSRVEVMVG